MKYGLSTDLIDDVVHLAKVGMKQFLFRLELFSLEEVNVEVQFLDMFCLSKDAGAATKELFGMVFCLCIEPVDLIWEKMMLDTGNGGNVDVQNLDPFKEVMVEVIVKLGLGQSLQKFPIWTLEGCNLMSRHVSALVVRGRATSVRDLLTSSELLRSPVER